MPVYGVDLSDYDWSRGPVNVAAMAADGIAFVTHKATESASIRHVHLADALNRAKAAGVPVLGAYHVVRSTPGVATQVAYFFAYLDQQVPWWRTWPGFLLQVDLEKWSYDPVSPATGAAFVAALRNAKPASAFVIVYASKGQYGNLLAGTGPLWNANYPSSRSAPYRQLYPGDNGVGWGIYSGQTPMFWQFASTATVGGQPTCDINAYRGTLDELLTTIGATMATSNDLLLNDWKQPVLPNGTPNDRGVGVELNDVWRWFQDGGGAYTTGPTRDPKTAPTTGQFLDGLLIAIRDQARANGQALIHLAAALAMVTTPTDEQLAVQADRIAAVLVASNANGLTAGDHAAVVADVKQALREGIT